ncbi:putative nucleolar complex protein 14 [Termitomyces sp. J132]|nr:putative nucleolar complex protein 14 [Termitomyces sp. J132]
MAKGSQLAQLKTALSKAGVTGQPQQGKKRKRSGSVDKDKEKRTAKLEEIHKRLNPFDTKVTKLKHDVGGRKVKGVSGKPAQSKQAGMEQRKRTLLKEFHEKDRAGGILDRRFGENDPSMSLEERMLERFTKERQRASKGTAFNLEDEDELTHYGQSLSKLDDFDDVGLGLDDVEEDTGMRQNRKIDADIVKNTHFGGFDDDDKEEEDSEEPSRKKSKAEVMAEVIAKSKEHKLRRQLEREHEDNVRHELDQEFDALRALIYAPDPSTGNDSTLLGGSGVETTSQPAVLTLPAVPEDYDQHVRELAFDKRAKPKDRTKTEEELALEEKEALEKAERRRRKRMLGLQESDSEDEGRSRIKRKRGGDDLEDDFVDDDEWNGLGAGLSGTIDNEVEASGSEKEASDQDDDEEAKELPFTFPCPSSHEEFLSIVDDVDDDDVPTVLKRIRALYHTSLSPDNKFKLQILATILIDHILYITSPPEPRFSLVLLMLPHLEALTKAYPVQVAEHFVEKLSLMQKNLKHGLSRGALDPEAKTWPGLSELTLLCIIGATWSTSDLNHAVVSPTRVLLGAYLGLSRVRSLSDIASGLFICTLFLQYEELSKRLVPEAVNFLTNTVLHLVPHHYKTVASLPGSFPSPDFRSDMCRPLALNTKVQSNIISQKANLSALLSGEPTEQAKADLLFLALSLLGRYADMYKSLEGFIELYDPILEILKHVDTASLAEALRTQLTSLSESLTRLLKFSRQAREPLRLQAHKPIPIPSYIPKFETTTSNYLRRQDPDHERNEASKLRNQYKQERKGAIRELRKDAKFLAGVEQQKQKEKDRAYHERMKRVFGSIEGERAEEKAMEREKAKAKRRAGRK